MPTEPHGALFELGRRTGDRSYEGWRQRRPCVCPTERGIVLMVLRQCPRHRLT